MGEVVDRPGPEISIGAASNSVIEKARKAMEANKMGELATQENQRIIPAQDASMVMMIERIAMDPNIPIDRLEKMLAMKERMEDRARDQLREDREYEAKAAYFAAMSACQKELPVVVKNKRNDHTKSSYADLAAIEDQAMPVIYKHGFGVSFQPDGYNEIGELRIKWEISHQGGYVRSGDAAIPVDGAGTNGTRNKTGTQAFGSTATYGRRYLLCMLFNISTGDDKDGNAPSQQAPEPISAAQMKEIQDLIEKGELEIQAFCERWKINAVAELTTAQFAEVVLSLKQRINWLAQQRKGNAA